MKRREKKKIARKKKSQKRTPGSEKIKVGRCEFLSTKAASRSQNLKKGAGPRGLSLQVNNIHQNNIAMKKSEIKKIIEAGGGMTLNAEKYSMDEPSTILNSTKALVVVDVPQSMTHNEVMRLAKEGSGHVFFTGERMREED